jgi:hypothetical protein
MSKLVTVQFSWFHVANNFECAAQSVLETLMDTLLQQGEPIHSLQFAYGSTVCVTFENGDQKLIDLLIKGKRGRPPKKS